MEYTEKEAMLDLALMGMYADGSLRIAEEDNLHKLMNNLGWDADTGQRASVISTSIARVRKARESDENIHQLLVELKKSLPTEEARLKAYNILERILNVDDQVEAREHELLRLTKWVFNS